MAQFLWAALVTLMTAGSAALDAKGFVDASMAWRNGQFQPGRAFQALLFFVGGVSLYIASIGVQHKLGNFSAAVQTTFWFVMTVIGVALMDSSLARWSMAQIAIAVAVVAGLLWLMVTAPQTAH